MKTLFIALIGFFLSVTLTGAEEPTTAPSNRMIADIKNGSVEIAGKVFALGSTADALVDQLGDPDSIEEKGDEKSISYAKSLGFSFQTSSGKLSQFRFFLCSDTSAFDAQFRQADVQTVEGLRAGSTQEQIMEAYGKPKSWMINHGVTCLDYDGVSLQVYEAGLVVIDMFHQP